MTTHTVTVAMHVFAPSSEDAHLCVETVLDEAHRSLSRNSHGRIENSTVLRITPHPLAAQETDNAEPR